MEQLQVNVRSVNGKLWYEFNVEGMPCTDRVYGVLPADEEGVEKFVEAVREFVSGRINHE